MASSAHPLDPTNVLPALDRARELAGDWFDTLVERPVRAAEGGDAVLTALGGPLPDQPTDALAVLDELAAGAAPGLTACPGPRYFGFVEGGSHPVATAADWLVSAWDQNAGLEAISPAAAAIEEVVLAWVQDLLGLPPEISGAFVTGGQMANVVGLIAARHQVLAQAGWDVNEDGLIGAPPIRVLVGGERHVSIERALRFIGLGRSCMVELPVDANGGLDPSTLADVLAEAEGPTIVCAQAGNVNSGAFDPLGTICELAHEQAAWVHVDGAFGLWAAASPRFRHLTEGIERADSWAVDMHKWLNVPYDAALAMTAHPDAHRAAMSVTASYLMASERRDPFDWTPEMSRRARVIPTWATLRALGRQGVADLVDRCCDRAARFAEHLGAADGVEVLNDVVLNQVVVRFAADDDITNDVIRRVQDEGTCWMSGTVWHGRAAMRVSVSNWATTEDDVNRSVAAILRCFAAVG